MEKLSFEENLTPTILDFCSFKRSVDFFNPAFLEVKGQSILNIGLDEMNM